MLTYQTTMGQSCCCCFWSRRPKSTRPSTSPNSVCQNSNKIEEGTRNAEERRRRQKKYIQRELIDESHKYSYQTNNITNEGKWKETADARTMYKNCWCFVIFSVCDFCFFSSSSYLFECRCVIWLLRYAALGYPRHPHTIITIIYRESYNSRRQPTTTLAYYKYLISCDGQWDNEPEWIDGVARSPAITNEENRKYYHFHSLEIKLYQLTQCLEGLGEWKMVEIFLSFQIFYRHTKLNLLLDKKKWTEFARSFCMLIHIYIQSILSVWVDRCAFSNWLYYLIWVMEIKMLL